jgi:hypothetical protein
MFATGTDKIGEKGGGPVEFKQRTLKRDADMICGNQPKTLFGAVT